MHSHNIMPVPSRISFNYLLSETELEILQMADPAHALYVSAHLNNKSYGSFWDLPFGA